MIEAQIERFAPGFRDRVLARPRCTAATRKQRESYRGRYQRGAANLAQLIARPVLATPYRTPLHGVYLCSSSTPPGGGSRHVRLSRCSGGVERPFI
jgi:phytoene dehydrogenase-like protein